MAVIPPNDRRLDRAVKHVSDYWFPVNESLLTEIQEQLKNTTDESGAVEIVSKIKSDFSLFFHCLRQLTKMLEGEEGATLDKDPLTILQERSVEELREILDCTGRDISLLGIDSGSEVQLARFHEMIVSSTASVEMAESYGIEEGSAFSAAVLRQLGLTLIAWNYSGVYEEVVGALKEGDDLSVKISEKLGFSPNLLAIRLLQSWGFSEGYCGNYGLVERDITSDSEGIQFAVNDTLVELCRVGECLARAHHPDIYPSARADWETAEREVISRLGKDGMALIQQRVEEATEVYRDFMPEVFSYGLDGLYELGYEQELPELDIESDRNPFLSCCEPSVARAIHSLYRTIALSNEASAAVQKFATEVIPSASFTGGCIYTADPSIMMLMPQYPFGELQLRRPEGLDYSVVLSNADMVSLAYQNPEPVIEYQLSPSGDVVTAIAGMFGGTQRVGVLYLELPDMVSDFVKDQQVLHFQALRHALVECLSLT